MWFLNSLVNAIGRANETAEVPAPKPAKPLTEDEYFAMWREPLLRRLWRRLTGR